MSGMPAYATPAYAQSETAALGQGEYLLCGWLEGASGAASSTPLAVAAPVPLAVTAFKASVSIEVPARIEAQPGSLPEWPATATVRWQANAPASLWADVRQASLGPCAADPAGEPSEASWLTGNEFANDASIGPHDAEGLATESAGSHSYPDGESKSGLYRVCAWVQKGYGEPVVIAAGPASQTVDMLPAPGELPGGGAAPLTSYAGQTSQRLALQIELVGDTVQQIVYSARFRCPRAVHFSTGELWNGVWKHAYLTTANFGTLTLKGGRFSAKLDRNPAAHFKISAHLSGGRITGSFSATMRTAPPQFATRAECRTGRVHFTIGTRGASGHRKRRGKHHHRRRKSPGRSNTRQSTSGLLR
jgi:hypothetical protein